MIKHPLSPSDIEVLIHCHACPGVHPRFNAPAVRKALDMFVVEGLVTWSNEHADTATTTPLGAAMVKALCNTRLPRTAFVDDNDSILGYQT